MKNTIFELYKPQSLADFLAFKKENPDESFVYVLQHPPENINILTAADFGTLVFCLPEKSQLIFSASPFVRKMKKCLQNFEPRDFILCLGDPAIIGLSTAIVHEVTMGLFNLLKWDRQERRYYPLTFDMNNRLETNRHSFAMGGSTIDIANADLTMSKIIVDRRKNDRGPKDTGAMEQKIEELQKQIKESLKQTKKGE